MQGRNFTGMKCNKLINAMVHFLNPPFTLKTFHQLRISKIKSIASSLSPIHFQFIIQDQDLNISRSLDLIINQKQILPSILILNDKLEVEWAQRGRNAFYFADPELMKHLKYEGWI